MFEPFGYEDTRNKQKSPVPSAVVAPQLAPSIKKIDNHEAVLPFIFPRMTSSARLGSMSSFAILPAVSLLVHC